MSTVKEKFAILGLALLKEHDDQQDPYVDDYPSARHAAKAHRAECETCKFIDAHRKEFNKLFSED